MRFFIIIHAFSKYYYGCLLGVNCHYTTSQEFYQQFQIKVLSPVVQVTS